MNRDGNPASRSTNTTYHGAIDAGHGVVAGNVNQSNITGSVTNNYYGQQHLKPVEGAAHDSHAEEHNDRCHDGTRKEVLQEIKSWARSPDTKPVYWLSGMAGTGKSTISRTVAHALNHDGHLGASFFFKRGDGDRGNASKFCVTIAAQIRDRQPALESVIRSAVAANASIATKAIHEQFGKLIVDPVSSPTLASRQKPLVVVVDALDECDNEKDMDLLIELFSQSNATRPSRIRFFVTSRPELPIRLGFKKMGEKIGDIPNFVLHEVPESVIKRDIDAVLRVRLEKIRQDFNILEMQALQIPSRWPKQEDFDCLVNMAIPLFIFAATVCRFLEDTITGRPDDKLQAFLSQGIADHGDRLQATYMPILNNQIEGRPVIDTKTLLAQFQSIVGSIILLARPISIGALAQLLDKKPGDITIRLNPLHSVILVPQNLYDPIRIFHLSFRDFLIAPERRGSPFWVDEQQTHRILALRCLVVMTRLKPDIARMQWPGRKRDTVSPQAIEHALPQELQYACIYWTHHLQHAKFSLHDGDDSHSFIKSHLLHWVEAMALLGRAFETFDAVRRLRTILQAS